MLQLCIGYIKKQEKYSEHILEFSTDVIYCLETIICTLIRTQS